MAIIVYNSRLARLVSHLVMPIRAITLWPFILIDGPEVSEATINHEKIHLAQYAETLILGFVLVYLFDYLYLRLRGRDHVQAYLGIRFEQEARDRDTDFFYLHYRSFWAWTRYPLKRKASA